MAVIRKDDRGIYAKVGGYIVRPTSPTKFSVGENVVGKHFGGSRRVGMGKAEGRGKYEEYWKTWHEDSEYEVWARYY